ncbi:MAG: hypothetical protein IKO14_02980 [Oscillibacter sp.]|nr:hypothetical protein [Oscillibacter sp.]
MSNVAGIAQSEAQKSSDMFGKCRYMDEITGGRGLTFATATPVMNSVVELYTMQNYLQPEALTARGIYNFDAWANQFAEVRTELQISPSGQGGRLKDTLSRYNNLNALQQMFTQFMDVVTDIPGLKIPKMKGGKRIVEECEPGEYQLNYMKDLADRAEKLKSGHVDPKVDNILKIGNDGRKISYSQRVMDKSLPYEPDGKIMKCAGNVAEIWKQTADRKGTQIIFCDYSTPKATGAKGAESELSKAEAALDAQEEAEAATIYQDMKNILVGIGVPANEIAFIHDAKNVEQRNQLFDAMNAGKVRVLIGSTGKMGVGMNAQKRVVALHHLDAPQRPGDVEQREGRALRQGNINGEVGIYVYVTSNTFDARSWDILQRKWTFIVQLQSGDFTGNSFEGDADVLSAAEIKAIASGNPLIQEQFELTADIQRLEGLERAHKRELYAAQDRLRVVRAAIAADTEAAAKLKADIAARRDTSGKNFSVTLDGETFAERKAAGESLIAHAKRFLKPGQSPEATKKIGTFAGFDLLTASGGDLVLRGQGQYRSGVNFESAVGTVQSLEAAARKLDGTLSAVESRLAANRDAIPELERASAAPFAQASELQQKRKRAGEILVELSDERKPSGEAASASEPVSAFRDTWEVVDDDSGVLKFREASSAKTGSHPDRWTAERVGDRDVTPLTGSEVIAKYRKIWDKNVTTGHIRGARGQYQHKGTGIGSGGIRLKIANDVPVFTHELGHALDEQYHLSETLQNPGKGMDEKVRLTKDGQTTVRQRLQARRELISNLDPKFAAQYKDKELLGEGIAEFFRRFCQNRVQASVDYPETYRFIMTTLSGTDQAQLLAMADDINALYSLDTENAQSSIKHMDAKAPDYRTKLERLDTLKDRFIQTTVDSLHSVKKLSQMMGSDVYKKFYNAAYADSRAYFNLTEYLCDLDGQYIAPSLRTVLHGVSVNDPQEFDAFGEYLVVRNAPSWIADDKRVLANDRKNNLLYCELRQKELEKQYPAFKATSEALYDFWDKFMRTYVVGTGLISEQQYDAMRAKHPFYVPFRRVMDDKQGFGTRRTFANQPNPVKRAKGSGRDIIHPVESIINAVAKLTYQGIHQQTMLDLIDTADAFGLDAAFMERVPTPLARQSANISGVKAEIAERVTNSDLPESDVELLLKILDEQGDMMAWYSQSAYLPPDCIGVRRNGEREVYKINDPLLFDALANMGRPYLNNEILRGYAATAEFPNGISDIITANASSLFGTVTIIEPMAQIWANADFQGMPIESARDRKLSPRQRYTGSTSQLAKMLGQANILSPKQIDFLGNNTLGAAWQYQKALFPVDASKRDWTLGVQGKYVKDSLYSQDSVNRLYDLAEKSSRDSMDDLTDIDNKVTAYFDGVMTDFYSRYNSIAKAEDDAGQSDRDARELVLTLIEDYLSAREDATLTAEQEAVYKVCRAAGDTSGMLPSARQNTVKDGEGTVRNLTAAQYYDYQGNFNSLYWNLVKEALPKASTDTERENVLKYAVDAAGEMAKNNVLIKLGAATTKEYGKYEQLQLYSVPVSTYLVAKAKTKDIESLKDKRTQKTLVCSQDALIAEAVLEMNLDLPETNVRKLMETLGVGKTVLDWSRSKLERELKRFRKEAGVG